MLTIDQIHEAVEDAAERRFSRRQIQRKIREARVDPISRSIKPHPYPDNAADWVISSMGLIPSMKQLRDIKRRAQSAQRKAA